MALVADLAPRPGAAVLIGGLTGGGLLWHFSKDLPALDQLGTYQPSLVTQVYSI